jgi:rod shape-determining protein MreC
MAVVGYQPPPFFNRGPAPWVRLTFFVAAAVALLVVDLRYRTLDWLRGSVATVVYPVQRLGYLPLQLMGAIADHFSSVDALQKENAELRSGALANANLLLRHQLMALENDRLRSLLEMKARQPAAGRVADIVFAARDPFARKVIIDIGSQGGIAPGSAVVDSVGVIGQVTRVFPLASEVTLLTDKDQAIPVQVLRNGLRAVLFGAGAGALELRYLAANADVQAGDTLVTSGLDGIYLPGLPVAKVTRNDHDAAYAFAQIVCAPLAAVDGAGQVLVLGKRPTPALDIPAQAASPDGKDKSAKPHKARKPER